MRLLTLTTRSFAFLLLIQLLSQSLISEEVNFNALLAPVPETAKFIDDDYFIWGASMVRDPDGKCHLFYSRWPRKLGHNAWATHSEIAHAVSENPLGPYKHVDIALPARGGDFWDGHCTHNPTIHEFDGKYYLYYMGNFGDGQAMEELNWTHRNHQRVGVAVADHPNGPWKRFDEPILDISPDKNAPDSLLTNNPSVCRRADNTYLLIYKAVTRNGEMPFGGPVVHLAATSESPTGPFNKHDGVVFTAPGDAFPAEDPFIWYQDGKHYAIVKDMHGAFTDAGRSLALFESEDGFDWGLSKHPLASKLESNWKESGIQKVEHLERPQLWIENGVPKILFCAVDEDRSHSFNVHIPLKAK